MNDLHDAYVFWDFDGVLCTYQALRDRCHIPTDDYLRSFITNPDQPFSFSRAPKTLVELHQSLDMNKQYVLTEETSSLEHAAKLAFLKNHYSFDPNNVIGVSSKEQKIVVMEAFYKCKLVELSKNWRNELIKTDPFLAEDVIRQRTERLRRQFIIIEDTISTINAAEEAGFSAIHVISLMP